MAFYELRQYKVLPGKMNEWLNLMESEIIPFQFLSCSFTFVVNPNSSTFLLKYFSILVDT